MRLQGRRCSRCILPKVGLSLLSESFHDPEFRHIVASHNVRHGEDAYCLRSVVTVYGLNSAEVSRDLGAHATPLRMI